MRSFRKMARFSKGLRVDESGLPGALLEAHQVMPVRRGAGYRTRGAKVRRTASTGDGLVGWHAFPVSLPLFEGAMFWTSPQATPVLSAAQFLPFSGTALSPTSLPMQPKNHLNANITGYAGAGQTTYGSNGSAAPLQHEMLFASMRARYSSGLPTRWAGLVTTTGYRTGTLAATAGQTVITGTGTAFVGNVRVGDFLFLDDGGLALAYGDRFPRVIEVRSNTVLVVDAPMQATFTGVGYRADALAPWVVKPGTFGAEGLTTTLTRDSLCYVRAVAQHRGRLFGLGTVEIDNVFYPDRLRWCAGPREISAGWKGSDYWDPGGYSDVAPGVGGTGRGTLVSVGSTLFIIKERAVFAFRGDVETDGRDVGATVSLFSDQDGLFGGEPVQVPGGALFCGREGLWLLTESGMRNLTDEAGLRDLWASMFPYTNSNPMEENEVGSIQALSVLDDRVIVHGGKHVGLGDPNTLVWHTAENVWTTQTTYATTRVIPVSRKLDVPIAGVYGNVAMLRNLERYYSGAGGCLVDWNDDHASAIVQEGGTNVVMSMTTHPMSVAEQGAMNGRVRAVQTKAALGEDYEDVVASLFPTARWKMDDASGSTVLDDVLGSNDLLVQVQVLSGVPALGVLSIPGAVNLEASRGLQFSDYTHTIPSPWPLTRWAWARTNANKPALNPTSGSPFTVCGWMKASAGLIVGQIAGNRTGTNGYDLWFEDDGFSGRKLKGSVGSTVITSGGVIPDDTWVFAALTSSGSDARLYLNGELDGSGAAAYVRDTVGLFRVAEGLGGALTAADEVMFFPTQLTADQIRRLYREGARLQALQTSVLMGEEGTSTAAEVVVGRDSAAAASHETERWYRGAVRDGTPPVDQVRIRLRQLDVSPRCIVYETGLEVVGVGRVRQ